MGIAYILTILNQHRHFDSLHWWDSARGVIQGEREDLRQREAGLKRRTDRDAAEDLIFQNKRLSASERELDMLYWSFSGARIFFRDNA